MPSSELVGAPPLRYIDTLSVREQPAIISFCKQVRASGGETPLEPAGTFLCVREIAELEFVQEHRVGPPASEHACFVANTYRNVFCWRLMIKCRKNKMNCSFG